MAELKKAGCYIFHSYDDAADDVKLAVQISLECFTSLIGEDMDSLVPLLYHTGVNSNHCTSKVPKSQTQWKFVTFCIIKRF